MIRYVLACGRGHTFEAWFRDGAGFAEQVEAKQVACPICGSEEVEKAPMAPNVVAPNASAGNGRDEKAAEPADRGNGDSKPEAQPLTDVDRVATAVRVRLEALGPHREAVSRGLAFLALPHNAALGTRCLYRTVDAIWYAAGDTATDYNFYTKRLLLAGVYTSTLLFWLNDRSEGYAQTWAFLDRRIGEVMRIGGTLGRTVGSLLDLPDRLLARRAAGLRR